MFLMFFGIFVIGIPLILVERGGNINRSRGEPHWVVRCSQALFVLFVVVFLTFLVLSHAATPEIVNGEYVLNDHGRIAGYISEKVYLSLKGWELRFFASGWILVYYILMKDGWFPRQDEWTVVMPD